MTSRKKHTWVLIFCIIALIILIFFKPYYGWRIRAWLGFIGSPQNAQSAENLSAQNQVLQAQLAALQNVMSQMPQNSHGDIRAMVLSQYPFGFKNELLLNTGSNQGVTQGRAVTFQGVFIGYIAKTFSDSSVVQTVFDPSFKMPVRLGSKGVDGLMVGGAFPKVTSITKDAVISSSDIIYTAGPGIPYALPIAIVNATNVSADRLFQEASLSFVYDLNKIETVLISR